MNTYDYIMEDVEQELSVAITIEEADAVRVDYLGKDGLIPNLLKSLGNHPVDVRPLIGQAIHNAKDAIVKAIDARKNVIRIVERIQD